MLIYGAGAALFDMLGKKTILREHIERVFEKDRDKIGVHSKALGVDIENAEAIKFLPSNSQIVIGEADYPSREWEVRRLNPYVKCITLEEAATAAKDREKSVLKKSGSQELAERTSGVSSLEEHIYLGLYDLTRMNMRRLGQDLEVGRNSYILEIQAQARGHFDAMETWEQECLLGQDYLETLYMRIMKRTPDQQEREKGLSRLQGNNGKYKLLAEVVKAGMKRGEG